MPWAARPGFLLRFSVRCRAPRQTPLQRRSGAPELPKEPFACAEDHSLTLPPGPDLDRTEGPAPEPRALGPAAGRAALGNRRPIPFLPLPPRKGIRTGSLAPHAGWCENLTLSALERSLETATYTEICTPRRSTRRLRPRFRATRPPSYGPLRCIAAPTGGARLRRTRLRPSIFGPGPFGW